MIFGPAGVPHSARPSTTQAGVKHIHELGLDCMEIQFVRGVKMGEATASAVRSVAETGRVSLSIHAPYYVNLNAHEPPKVEASRQMLLQSARIGAICGARAVIFHAAFYLQDPPELVYARVRDSLVDLAAQIRQEGLPVLLRPEVSGRASQFGSLDEILSLGAEIEGVAPCIDFSHLHAREGKSNTYEEFSSVLEAVERRLGRSGLERLHLHVSGIVYGARGELKHADLGESDLHYRELLQALHDCRAAGTVICESPNLEADAALLKETYREIGAAAKTGKAAKARAPRARRPGS